MKVCGIIAEYNPFHNGHKYHIDYTRRELSCDYIVVVMSGNFVQRGAPAIIDKYYRTRMALVGGADIVIELPTFYALQSAQYFAQGSVHLLDGLGVIDSISYGSESFETPAKDIIDYIANLTEEEKITIEDNISTYTLAGNSYPQSYSMAIADYVCKNGFAKEDVLDTLTKPNTILELMYLEALNRLSSNIIPFKVARKDADYHEKIISGTIASATAIRNSIAKNNMYLNCVPNSCIKFIQSAINETGGPIIAERYFDTFIYSLLKNEEELKNVPDVSGGLDMRMMKMINTSPCMDDYIKDVKSKSYTYARVARTIFNLILGITADDAMLLRYDMPLYARILGFKKEASKVINLMHEKAKIPIFTQPAKFEPSIDSQKRLFEIDLKAGDIYNLHASKPFSKGSDFTNQIIVL